MNASSLLQRIYESSPVQMQNLMTSVKGVQLNRARYGRVYWQHRDWLASFDRLSYDDKLKHQQHLLNDFVRHAHDRSAYYRDLYRAAGVDVAGIRTIEDLSRLPTVDKEDLRANIDEIVVRDLGKTYESHTGGTTGKSLVVRTWDEDLQRRMAMLDHFKHRLGFEHRKMRRASFVGRHLVPPHRTGGPYSRYNHACKQLLLSSFHLNESAADAFVADLNRFRPTSLDGFTSSMVVLARYMLANGIKLDNRPTTIFPTSETLTETDRETLETAFGATVYNQYASSEGAPFITECSAGNLHVEMSTGVFEYQENGEVFVTSFHTRATPLVRYRIGDHARSSPARTCECGVESEMVESITGRGSHFLYRSDGTPVYAPNLANILKVVPNAIVEAQLTQRDMGSVTLHVVVDSDSYQDAYDDLLRDAFCHKFDPDTSLTIARVDAIPTEPSGKRPFVKNLVDSPRG